MSEIKTKNLFEGAAFNYEGKPFEVHHWVPVGGLWMARSKASKFAPVEDLQTIPLTAEILREWFGATIEKFDDHYKWERFDSARWPSLYVAKINGENGFSVFTLNHDEIVVIQYVHQLQAVLFGITDHNVKLPQE